MFCPRCDDCIETEPIYYYPPKKIDIAKIVKDLVDDSIIKKPIKFICAMDMSSFVPGYEKFSSVDYWGLKFLNDTRRFIGCDFCGEQSYRFIESLNYYGCKKCLIEIQKTSYHLLPKVESKA